MNGIGVRNICKKCHNKQARTRHDLFDNILLEEVEILESLDEVERIKKLEKYTKTDLHKLMTHYKIGRKYNDVKNDCVIKIIEYFSQSN